MRMKKWLSYLAVPFAVAILVGGIATQTWGGEKGKLRCQGGIVTIKANNLEVPVKIPHTLVLGQDDGVIFNETEGAFLDGARYQLYWVADMTGEDVQFKGYKVFTMADGSQVFGKFEGGLSGTWTFIGGTGKYEGVKGSGTYKATALADTVYWDILEGEYELP
ncbi:MAG: hypothetical protein JSW15_07335 [Deltaproteobacteria bacterium]|nr:MAG: hypothetical protein JSW15_07335 [Deltaproteobacteria bacterium]